jgi:glycosyltransferase involved in cell wall biosynthesis
MTLTRDRLDYTKHCYATLTEHAGCDFDWYVTDQGSQDGTPDWLEAWTDAIVTRLPANIGIGPALNRMLDEQLNPSDYDMIVKWDNDCELLTQNTLRDIAALTCEYGLLLSPQIHGLLNPPATVGTPLSLGGTLVDEKRQIGGIFLAAPATVYDDDGFRYSDGLPVWGGDDTEICAWWQTRGGRCGYVQGYDANHYLGTEGQHRDKPDYFARRVLEGGPV